MRTERLVPGLNNLQKILVYVDDVTFMTTIKQALSDTFFQDPLLRSFVKQHLTEYVSYFQPQVNRSILEVWTYSHKKEKYEYQIGIQLA